MIKIGILNPGTALRWGHNFGYWYFLKYFQKELFQNGYIIKFYKQINKDFLKSDLICNSIYFVFINKVPFIN